MIEVKELSFRYAKNEAEMWALKDLNLSICEGEWVAVIGPNGSGKSTLAKQLNALLRPERGRVLVDSLDTSDQECLWDIRQRVGMIFQNPDNQLLASVVEEDVAFGPENMGLSPGEIRERVEQALIAVGMLDFARRDVHGLSGGQKQRVAIAGVLAMRPKYLIMDEATAMLDPRGRHEVMQTVRHLNQEEGLAVINITHFMEEAASASRLVVMDWGETVLQGSPREIFQQVDLLQQIGLDIPPIVTLRLELDKRGVDLPSTIVTLDEMVDALCALN